MEQALMKVKKKGYPAGTWIFYAIPDSFIYLTPKAYCHECGLFAYDYGGTFYMIFFSNGAECYFRGYICHECMERITKCNEFLPYMVEEYSFNLSFLKCLLKYQKELEKLEKLYYCRK